jgi:hypothetical protein
MKINVVDHDDKVCLIISIIVFPYAYGILILLYSIGYVLMGRLIKYL